MFMRQKVIGGHFKPSPYTPRLTTHYSLLTTHYSLLTTHSPLPTPRSPFPTSNFPPNFFPNFSVFFLAACRCRPHTRWEGIGAADRRYRARDPRKTPADLGKSATWGVCPASLRSRRRGEGSASLESESARDFNDGVALWPKGFPKGRGFSLPGWDSRATPLKLSFDSRFPCVLLEARSASARRNRDIG